MSRHVFLSYSREDTELMLKLERYLKSAGISTWSDSRLVPGTSHWQSEIEKALEAAQIVIALLSPSAKNSEWVDLELEYARIRNIAIVPLLIRGDAVSSVPFKLVSSQWIDMTGDDKFDTGSEKLVEVLRQKYGVEAKSRSYRIHEALVNIARKLPNFRSIGLISVDGLSLGYYSVWYTI